jgi:hypothetical protein
MIPAMNPIVILIPVALLLGGVLTFFLMPLSIWLRTTLLVGDLVAAIIVGLILWRRYQA